MFKLLAVLFVAVMSCSLHAKIKVCSIFSDGMVLQRNSNVPVWGWAEPGEKVEVTFNQQTCTAETGQDGKWMVELEPMKASSDETQMVIKAGEKKKVISGVVVGEVWLCTGQSNMNYTLKGCSVPSKNSYYHPVSQAITQEMNSAEDPLLRQIRVSHSVSALDGKDGFYGKWIQSSPKDNPAFTAAGYYFARELRKKLNVPVGLISSNAGGTRVQAWIDPKAYSGVTEYKNYYDTYIEKTLKDQKTWDPQVLVDYKKKLDAITDPQKKKRFRWKKPREPMNDSRVPGTLYNGMINPVVPYAVKGAIWYQGEANVGYMADQYSSYLTLLINGWRKAWNQNDLSFYIAQLANLNNAKPNPVEKDNWATVSNEQRLVSNTLEKTGLAVLNDIGEAEDIHPRNKIEVGQRLALWALAKDYGYTDLVYSGPIYSGCSFNSNKVTVTFESVADGLMVGKKPLLKPAVQVEEPLKGFQICGADRVWKWAEAKIADTNTVVVSHPEITEPVEVRYAWSSNPASANLYNKEGLPTSLFSCSKRGN